MSIVLGDMTDVEIHIAVFGLKASFSVIGSYQRFGGTYYLKFLP
jgi:hypothetical protein